MAQKKATPAPVKAAVPAATPASTEPTTAAAPVVDQAAAQPIKISIFDELAAGAKNSGFVAYVSGEDVQKYLAAFCNAVYSVPEETWKGFSDPAQAWYNEASAAINAGTAIALPPGFPEVPAGDAPAVAAKPAKGEKAPKPAKEPKPAKAAKPEKAPRERGITTIIREMVILRPLIKPEQLKIELMNEHGFKDEQLKMSSISTIRTDALSTVSLAKKLGYWRDEPKTD